MQSDVYSRFGCRVTQESVVECVQACFQCKWVITNLSGKIVQTGQDALLCLPIDRRGCSFTNPHQVAIMDARDNIVGLIECTIRNAERCCQLKIEPLCFQLHDDILSSK